MAGLRHGNPCGPEAMKKLILLCLALLVAMPLLGDWRREEERIAYLLDQIGRIEGVVIRNGTIHPPAEAVEHLRMKLKLARNSWFSPPREEWTAEMFIDRLASRSSMSGKPYRIRFSDDREIDSGPWLHDRLRDIEKQEHH